VKNPATMAGFNTI